MQGNGKRIAKIFYHLNGTIVRAVIHNHHFETLKALGSERFETRFQQLASVPVDHDHGHLHGIRLVYDSSSGRRSPKRLDRERDKGILILTPLVPSSERSASDNGAT